MSQSTRGSRTTSGWGRPEAGHTALDDMAMLEQLLDSLDQGVMVVDLTGEIVYWNTATDLLFSWPEAEALARSALHLWREAEGRPRKAVAHGRAFDGVMTVSPVTDHRGETFAVAAVVGDLPGLQDRLTQARRLLTGLAEGELEVFYQPVIDLATGAAVAAEALVRWHHPDRGLLLPGDFIPLAEETGVVVELGRWVLNQACVTAAGWPGGPKVAVNLSARQLSDSALVDDVAAALIASGLAPDRLVVEVTETSVMSDPERARIALCALKELGVTIAIDDFGTGYSSLAYLNLLPVDEVKLDGCFASALASGEGSPALVQAIVAMAAALNVALVVEGVETDDQRRQLAALGCQLAQGFLWSEPVPAGSLRLAQPVLA